MEDTHSVFKFMDSTEVRTVQGGCSPILAAESKGIFLSKTIVDRRILMATGLNRRVAKFL